MATVLVVFEQVPETSDLYVLRDIGSKELEKLRRFHKVYINSSEDEKLEDEINEFFFTKDGINKFEPDNDGECLVDQTFDLVIQTGIVM